MMLGCVSMATTTRCSGAWDIAIAIPHLARKACRIAFKEVAECVVVWLMVCRLLFHLVFILAIKMLVPAMAMSVASARGWSPYFQLV